MRAAISLPTPGGPEIRTRLPVGATRFSVARTVLITGWTFTAVPARDADGPARCGPDPSRPGAGDAPTRVGGTTAVRRWSDAWLCPLLIVGMGLIVHIGDINMMSS